MFQIEPGKWFRRLFSMGANPDTEPELRPDGEYQNAQNMRPVAINGTRGSVDKVGGEEVLYIPDPQDQPLNNDYICIGAFSARQDDVSFHASPVAGLPPVILVNGVKMVESPLIPYRWDQPLQCAPVNREQGSILFPVDGVSPPLFWDIEAIKLAYASGDQTFFSQFNLQQVSVVPAGPTEWPEHMGNPNIGNGALPGKYMAFLRFFDADGNRSNFGPPTPLMDVPRVQAPVYSFSGQYPGGQTTGGVTVINNAIPTPYGIELRFQVDNIANYAGVEVIVTKWNDGQGLNGVGETEVVYRLDTPPGFLDKVTFVYPRDNNFSEIIPVDEAAQQLVNFTAPKAAEYIDNKLVYSNFTLRDESVDVQFQSSGGNTTFPFTHRVFTRYNGQDYNDGYSDPRNNTYCKSAVHDERYGAGFMFWDGSAAKSFVCEVDNNIKMPERGRRKDGDALRYSTDRIDRTNTECQGPDPVSPTFDAIVQGSLSKADDSFTSVVQSSLYNPFRPISPTDTNFVRYRQKPMAEHRTGAGVNIPDVGACFAPEIHALGLGVYGPDNADTAIPDWEVMSVMRTAPANRVVASGMGVYYQPPVSGTLTAQSGRFKNWDRLITWFPDIDSGVVPASVAEDIRVNPQNYKLKFTPYGFYGEVYAYRNEASPFTPEFFDGAFGIDRVTYMDIQHEPNPGTPGVVNNTNASIPQGIQPSFSSTQVNNIGWQAWRRLSTDLPPSGPAGSPTYLWWLDPANTDQGASEIGLLSFTPEVEGRGRVYNIQTDKPLYRGDDLNCGLEFPDTNTRRYHGPMWVVDIIRSDAQVPTLNVQQYLHTGTHVARARTIGLFEPNAQGFMDLELFHARLYDAVPRAGDTPFRRYAYVRTLGQPERRWMFAGSDLGGAVIQDVYDAINNNGFWVDPDGNEVYGVYSWVSDDSGPYRVYFLRFGEFTQIPPPPVGSRIVVKYDKREPVLVRGFDATISPWAWAALDRSYNAAISPFEGFYSRVPMPYAGGIRSSNYVLPRDGQSPSASVEDLAWSNPVTIRQWLVMGHLVTRTQGVMNLGDDTGLARNSFPRNHYIIRPSRHNSASGLANGFRAEYDVDYPGEAGLFGFGGFRFQNVYNLDYSRQPLTSGLGTPISGTNPRKRLPTGFLASASYNPIAQDSAGLRTFTFDNLFVADEGHGEVKMIAALDQGGRQALWAWAEEGYFNIPYNAQMLTDADGNVIGTQSISNFWPRRENWIARGDHGMPDESWRVATKANALTGKDRFDTVFWSDRQSSYMLVGGRAVDLLEEGYRSELHPVLSSVSIQGTGNFTSIYNRRNNEWWSSFEVPVADGTTEVRVYVFSPVTRKWAGYFTYDHQQYISDKRGTRGFTGLSGWTIDSGVLMRDGLPVEGWAEMAFAPFPGTQSELVAWRVNPDKPDEMRVFDKGGNLMLTTSEVLQEAAIPGSGFLWVMEIDGYQQLMNSVDPAYAAFVGAEPQPPQSTNFKVRWYFRQPKPQRITFGGVQARQLS